MTSPSNIAEIEERLLSPDLLARLERLSIGTKRRLRGNVLGGRRSVRHGASVEFTDYRDYLPGDDLRYVDWKAYARLSKLLVRLFTEEDDLTLHLMLDASASMGYGQPISKLRFSQRLCAALGVIALSSFDRCTFSALQVGHTRSSGVLRGASSVGTLLRGLESTHAEGSARLTPGLMRYAAGKVSPGVVVIVSDFYEHDISVGLLARLARRHNVVLAHIADPAEVDPSASIGMDGDEVRLVDSETGAFVEITLTPAVLADYQRQFGEFCSGIETLAKSAGATYLRITTGTPIEDVVLGSLRQKRVIE